MSEAVGHVHSLLFVMVLLVSVLFSGAPQASEFRSFRPIPTPQMTASAMQQGGIVGGVIRPVSRQLAERVAGKIVQAWNRNAVDSVLGEAFYDRTRLQDSMNTRVPRDAQLEILSIQDVQTLGQQIVGDDGRKALVSTVAITMRTQITYNEASSGQYRRLEGTNEYVVKIRQPLIPAGRPQN